MGLDLSERSFFVVKLLNTAMNHNQILHDVSRTYFEYVVSFSFVFSKNLNFVHVSLKVALHFQKFR